MSGFIRKQVKFCGFTRKQDVDASQKLGIDAIGLVFYPPSPRYVTAQQAAIITKDVSAFTSIVALVVNIDSTELSLLADVVRFDVIQFHGDETASECQQLANSINKRWIKALRINSQKYSQRQVSEFIDDYYQAGASAIILDAYSRKAYGGTGESFDWSIIPQDVKLPIILAGGLTPENVIQTKNLSISGVDVSGGIESEKGIKDIKKMESFIANL